MNAAKLTGLLLIAVPVAFNITFFLLQRTFEYPEVLRQPAGTILLRFKQGGPPLRRLWYAFTFSAVLFTPVPVLVQQLFEPDPPWFLVIGTVIGVLAGVVQFLGLIRWPFLVPSLAEIFTDPNSTPAARDSAAVTFQAFHRYAGVAVGEHLGYLFTTTWTVILCIAIIQTGIINPLFGWLGLIPAVGVLAGLLEEAGLKAAGAVNAIGYILWSIWLVAFGIAVLLL